MKPTVKQALAFATLLMATIAGLLLIPDEPTQHSLPRTAAPQDQELVASQTRELLAHQFHSSDEMTRLVELAKQRRGLMAKLIEKSPEDALELAYTYAEYHSLPSELQAFAEIPFTETADYRVQAVCDHDHSTPQTHQFLTSSHIGRAEVSSSFPSRLSVSKNGTPVQGIALESSAAVRSDIFQKLDDASTVWATENLPLANFDPSTDFLTNQPIEGTAIVAVSGGYRFHFANAENLARLEAQLISLDDRPGLDTGSSALFTSLRLEAAPFSPETFFAQQEIAATPPTDEVRNYLIIRVDFSDLPGAPTTQSDLESLVNERIAPTLAEYSYHKTTVQASVTEAVFRLPSPSSTYIDTSGPYDDVETQPLYQDAIAAYIAAGNPNPTTQYDLVSVNFPQLTNNWAGLATVGGIEQWLQGSPSADTILHELGHNYGLLHAQYWQHDASDPSSQDPVDPSGASENYGDIFDNMGDGSIANGHFHMAAKRYLGWIGNTDWQDLTSAADNGTHRIYAFDDPAATGLQALRINKSGTSERYWVGYRKAYPGVPNFDKGAYLVWQRPFVSSNQSWLVDTTPGSAEGKIDSGIALGKTYSDAAADVHITPLAAGTDANGNYLDVAVNLGAFDGNQAPSGNLTATETGEARTPISFSFVGSDPDGDSLAYHWDFGDGTVEISSADVQHSFPVGGSFTLKLTVSDMKGGTFTQEANVEITDPINQYTTRDSGTSRDLNVLAANDTHVLAAGASGTVLSSTDGITWTKESLPGFAANVVISDIVWTGQEFIAVGMDYDSQWVGVVYTSPDGDIWTLDLKTSESVGNIGFNSVAYDPTSATLVIARSDGKLRVRDPAGVWSIIDLGIVLDVYEKATNVVWAGNRFVVGGYNFSRPTPSERLVLFNSSDGLTWENVAAESEILDWKGLRNLAFINDTLIGSGYKSGMVYSDDSGYSWSTNQQGVYYRTPAVAYGNSVFSAHGIIDNEPDQQGSPEDTVQDFLSIDGRTWIPAGEPSSAYNDRIFFADTFISVGGAGLIVQSAVFGIQETNPFLTWMSAYTDDTDNLAADANPDLDWAPNLLEFALGSNPLDPQSTPAAPILRYTADRNASISIFRYEKNADATLSLELSTDLVDWAPLSTITTVDTDSLLELTSTETFLNTPKLFIRVKAEM